jgi:hypothetical protein
MESNGTRTASDSGRNPLPGEARYSMENPKGTTEDFFTQWTYIDGTNTLLGISITPSHSGTEHFALLRCFYISQSQMYAIQLYELQRYQEAKRSFLET